MSEGSDEDQPQQQTVYERVGGMAFFVELVERFYAGVEADPRLRPMYPEDLTAPKENLAGFLVQFWGGPDTYSRERGHPRLRMRHMPFEIREEHRDAWFENMAAAVRSMGADPDVEAAMLEYFERSADFLVNSPPIRRRPT